MWSKTIMRVRYEILRGALPILLSAASMAMPAYASDHDEAPLVKGDASVDLTDLYVFKTSDTETTAITCWGGFNDSRPQPDAEGLYNPNALYTLHIDNNQDNIADIRVQWRFGQSRSGDWGVRAENVPGSAGAITGPIETVLDGGNGTRIWAGHADEPFFFDVQGYLDSLATGTLMIRNDTSVLAGLNVTCFAAEIETAAMRNGTQPLQFWITAARK